MLNANQAIKIDSHAIFELQVVIQNAPLDKFDTRSAPKGFEPLKFSTILKMMPELLNQPHTIVSVYKKQTGVAAMDATEETKELMGNIADILGKGVQIVFRLVTKNYYCLLKLEFCFS